MALWLVRARKFSEYEDDGNLKDFENIPLKEDIVSYVLREVTDGK